MNKTAAPSDFMMRPPRLKIGLKTGSTPSISNHSSLTKRHKRKNSSHCWSSSALMMFKPLSLLFFCFFSVAVFTSVQAKPQPAAPAEPPSVVELEAHAQFVVNTVNAANAGWTAKLYPRFARMSPVERRAMHGLKMPSLFSRRQPRPETPMLLAPEQLPEEFDPRQKWPECTEVINNIRDQSRCGDCWAISAAGAFSDRICIASGGKLKVSVSGIDTASCAEEGLDGCQGASDLSPAWLYFQKSGAVTGSNYTLKAGCKPYPFPPSDQATRDYSAPVCAPKCTNRRYRQHSYVQDKHYVSDPIEIHSEDWHKVENLIKQEVMLNGSVTVGFAVYTDFMYYHSGVYKHTWGSAEGGHAVRLVGWGVDKSSKAGNKNTPYWLIANSWGPHWGEAGFFRIQRGTNEAEIEGMVDPYAGAPRLE